MNDLSTELYSQPITHLMFNPENIRTKALLKMHLFPDTKQLEDFLNQIKHDIEENGQITPCKAVRTGSPTMITVGFRRCFAQLQRNYGFIYGYEAQMLGIELTEAQIENNRWVYEVIKKAITGEYTAFQAESRVDSKEGCRPHKDLWQEITPPVTFTEDYGDRMAILGDQIRTNNSGLKYDLFQRGQVYDLFRKEGHDSASGIAKLCGMGKSDQDVRDGLMVFDTPQEVRDLIDSGQIKPNAVLSIAKRVGIDNPDKILQEAKSAIGTAEQRHNESGGKGSSGPASSRDTEPGLSPKKSISAIDESIEYLANEQPDSFHLPYLQELQNQFSKKETDYKSLLDALDDKIGDPLQTLSDVNEGLHEAKASKEAQSLVRDIIEHLKSGDGRVKLLTAKIMEYEFVLKPNLYAIQKPNQASENNAGEAV